MSRRTRGLRSNVLGIVTFGWMVSWLGWLTVLAVLAVLLVIDLLAHRHPGASASLRFAVISSVGWIAAATLFGVLLGIWQGADLSAQYFSGYLLEKALSVDNVFVFAVIFTSLRVPRELQHPVLYIGVIGALVLRAGFIAAGGALIDNVSWTVYVFGLVLLLAGARMLRGGHVRVERNPVVRALRRVVPITPDFHGDRFFTSVDGRRVGTGLLLALVVVETTDLVFATDSIPAIFGVTRNVFVVFTSNAFAVLGLRALYFLLAEAMDRFVYLTRGLALLLVLIGAKMLLSHIVTVPVVASLLGIVAILGFSVLLSLRRSPTQSRVNGDDR